MNRISLAIVDDDQLITKLLNDYLSSQVSIEVLFTSLSGKECLVELEKGDALPDVMLLDLNMKEMSGVELTKLIKKQYPTVKIIVISSHYKRNFMGFMIKAGVAAFVPKGISPTHLLEIIQEVQSKGVYFMDDQLEVIRKQLSSKAPGPILDSKKLLSAREMDVLRLICRQKTAKEIGEELFVTKRTVEGHKNSLFTKTGTKNMAGLVIYSIQNGLIDIKDLPHL